MKQCSFDVVVVGGGHAGCEAAYAAARMGANTALVTLKQSDIGVMSCNPAIGGLGKGHLVREIDALGGVMGVVADKAGIQFRLLNRRKGPAVQGPRAQADRKLYQEHMQRALGATPSLQIIEGEVASFEFEGDTVVGVNLIDGAQIKTKTTILTSGTFLNGVIHIGNERKSGGRMGDKPSVPLANQLLSLDLKMGRLKTGTPPRLNGETIDWSVLDSQPGDESPTMFSFLHDRPFANQISCGITFTNEATHDVIRKNLEHSSMYGGYIEGVGPRYCPSIEDKVVRFADKTSHQVFLEPEGLSDKTVYPNGISTSLPYEVQVNYVRSMKGLESVEILQPGYAIEYDFVDPRALSSTLELGGYHGLFLAGQINGTTGYEEAAAQGLVAGLNAAAVALDRDPITFSRADSYIGVMVDDLTTLGVTEPYRMFTSRAEYRLTLRADNADQRLSPLAQDLGILGPDRVSGFEVKMEELQAGRAILDNLKVTPSDLEKIGITSKKDGQKRSLFQVLSFPGTDLGTINQLYPEGLGISDRIAVQLKNDATYATYAERQKREMEVLKRDEKTIFPETFVYDDIDGLSSELRKKLTLVRPDNIAQAARIEGMTPAALVLLLAKIKKFHQAKSA